MATTHKALNLVEDLLKAYIATSTDAALTGVTVCRGFEVVDVTSKNKRIEIVSYGAKPEQIEDYITGNVVVSAGVAVVTHYGDVSRADQATLAGAVWDMFEQSALPTALNAITTVTGMSVYGSGQGGGEGVVIEGIERTVDGHEFREEMRLTLYVSLHD